MHDQLGAPGSKHAAAAPVGGTTVGKATRVDAASARGQPLPAGLQAKFERSLGAELSSVRIHTDAAAAGAASARAFAVGHDIHFAPGEYAPDTRAGELLLAHEVAHTVQQGVQVRRYKLATSQPTDAHEVEADAAAEAMVAGVPARTSAAPRQIARKLTASLGDIAASNDADGGWQYNSGGYRFDVHTRALFKANSGYTVSAQDGVNNPVNGQGYHLVGSHGEFTDILIWNQPGALAGLPFTINATGMAKPSVTLVGTRIDPRQSVVPAGEGKGQVFADSTWLISCGSYYTLELNVEGVLWKQASSPFDFINGLANWFDSNVLEPLYDDVVQPFISELASLVPYFHTVLGALGSLAPPPWDIAASLANAALYVAQGQDVNAALAAVGALGKIVTLARGASAFENGTAIAGDASKAISYYAKALPQLQKVDAALSNQISNLGPKSLAAADAIAKFSSKAVPATVLSTALKLKSAYGNFEKLQSHVGDAIDAVESHLHG